MATVFIHPHPNLPPSRGKEEEERGLFLSRPRLDPSSFDKLRMSGWERGTGDHKGHPYGLDVGREGRGRV